MNQSVILLVLILVMTSCISSKQSNKTADQKKNIIEIKLTQNPEVISVSKAGSIPGIKKQLSTIYKASFFTNDKPEAVVKFPELNFKASSSSDSLAFIILDHEMVRLELIPKTENSILIPENLWISIAHSQKIEYLLFPVKGKLIVTLDIPETEKLQEYFMEAMERNTAIHPIVPEGKKKW